MKNSVFSISFIAFVFVFTSFAPSTKNKYSSTEGKLSIEFPAPFETRNTENEDQTTVKIETTFEDQLYFVSYTIHKVKMTDHELMAATSLESFNEALGGTITKQANWMIKKHNGLQADIEIPEKNLRGEYRVLLIDQIQYQIVVLSESTNWNQVNADKFINSFEIKK